MKEKLLVLGYYKEGDVLDQGGYEQSFTPILILQDEEEARKMVRGCAQARDEFESKAPSRRKPEGCSVASAYYATRAKDRLFYRDAAEARLADLWYDFESTPEYPSLFEAAHCETFFAVNAR